MDMGTSVLTLLSIFPNTNGQKKAWLWVMVSLIPHHRHVYFSLTVTLTEDNKNTRTCFPLWLSLGFAGKPKGKSQERRLPSFKDTGPPSLSILLTYTMGIGHQDVSSSYWPLPASQVLPICPIGLCTGNNSIGLRKTLSGRKMFWWKVLLLI